MAEAQQKIVNILKNDPTLAKKLDDARKVSTSSSAVSAANYGLSVSKEEFDRKQALYTMQSKIIDDDKTMSTQQKTERKNSLYNSIF